VSKLICIPSIEKSAKTIVENCPATQIQNFRKKIIQKYYHLGNISDVGKYKALRSFFQNGGEPRPMHHICEVLEEE
jgi:hypothetical protein